MYIPRAFAYLYHFHGRFLAAPLWRIFEPTICINAAVISVVVLFLRVVNVIICSTSHFHRFVDFYSQTSCPFTDVNLGKRLAEAARPVIIHSLLAELVTPPFQG
jgi:hypothetical protein